MPTAARHTRRRILLGAAAAGLAGPLLQACGRPGRPPQTSPGAVRIRLVMQPNGTLPWSRTMQSLYQQALRPFYAANPGVDVQLVPTRWNANVQDILAGQAADVISDNYPPPYMAEGGALLLGLDDRVRKDNLDLSRWSAGQVASYRQAAPDQALYMLPAYFSPLIYVVRLDAFRTAGLQPPGAGWTHEDFATLCQHLAGRLPDGRRRYGAVLEWDSDHIGEGTWPFFAFGDGMQDGHGNAALAGAANVQAGNWLYERLLWPGYATTRDKLGPWYDSMEVIDGQVVMQLVWDGLVLDNAQRYRGFDWDYAPPPIFPQGPTCMGTDDFYAVAATTKYPDQAWALLKFLCYDGTASGWQRSVMKIGLLQPSLNSLWDVWMATVRAAAPALQNKHLEYFQQIAVAGRAFPEQYWRRVDRACQSLTSPHMLDLWAHRTDVPTAFGAIDTQVNALLAEADAAAAAAARLQPAISAVRPGPGAAYPAPNRSGAGIAAVPATQLVRPGSGSGPWTLLGDGTAVGGVMDSAVFAGLATTASVGEWTCRLTAVADVSCTDASGSPALSGNLQVGLMARGDLSDDAPFVSIQLTGAHRIQVQNRPVPDVAPLSTAALGPPAPSGQPAPLTAALRPVPANLLAAPLWLRLARQGLVWTCSASLDGKNFVALGGPQHCRALGGAWVGLVACAHNGDFGAKGYIRAVFDQISFAPTDLVQIGMLGTPPDAGAVPAGWSGG